jgi:hypothetical protein
MRLLPFRTLRSRYARNDKRGGEIASFQDAWRLLRCARNDKMGYEIASLQDASRLLRYARNDRFLCHREDVPQGRRSDLWVLF